MLNTTELEINFIDNIISKVIGEIDSSRVEILSIVDNIRKEQENLKVQLTGIRDDVLKVINDVNELEKLDKVCRKKLAEVSANFSKYSESDIRTAYEKASDIRIRFFAKQAEERSLRERRDYLEMAIKKSIANIDSGEKIINQIGIAIGYLEGNILPALDCADKNSEMFMGIKILEAQESERKRIARDIHDGPAQHMANVVMKVDICTMVMQKDIQKGLTELKELKDSVKAALSEVRSIIFDLRPMSLDDLGLGETIQQTVKAIFQGLGVETKVKIMPVKKEIEQIIQVAVYRIVQEILNNIKKHSKARNVELKLDFGTKYLMLVITDDGVGFDVEDTLKKVKNNGVSYGLIGIFERVNQLQGIIKIKSSEGAGTIFSVKLPINREVIHDEKQGN